MNNGNLGYFTVFQMITPFEEAAYTLKTRSISMPVRTPYGYHIIKVTDRRPSKGKIQVAHIMKAAPPGASEETVKKAETEINDIYSRLTGMVNHSRNWHQPILIIKNLRQMEVNLTGLEQER